MKIQYVVFTVVFVFQFLPISAESPKHPKYDLKIAVIDSLNALSNKLLQEDPQKSIFLGGEALHLATDFNDQEKIFESLLHIGEGHLAKGEHHTALNFFYRSLKIARNENYNVGIISALNNIGILYFRLGDYQNSLFYLTESQKLGKELKDDSSVSLTLNHIGRVYQKLKDHHTALKFYMEAMKIQEAIGDGKLFVGTLNNIGNLHFENQKYVDAISFYTRSIGLCEASGHKKGLADAYKGLGLVNKSLEEFQLSKENFLYSLDLSLKNHDKINVSENYFHLARLAFENKDYEESLDLNYKSYELALDMSAKERLKDNYDLYAKIYAKLKDFEGAYSYLAKANALKEILFNENISRSLSHILIAEEEAKYRQILHIKDLEIEAGKEKAAFLYIILILLIILSCLIYLMYRIKAKKKKELEIAHLLINDQNTKLSNLNENLDELVKAKTTELISTNEKLQSALKELDTFIYKTSHDIKGPLARLMGLCNVALLDIKHKKSIEYFEMLNNTANYLNSTLVRLLTVIDIKNNETKEEKIDFNGLIKEILNNNRLQEGFDKLRFEINIDENINAISDPIILNLILQNLLENSIKYHNKFDEPDPFISLNIQDQENKLQINIIDNGLGINRKDLMLFEMFSKASIDSHAAGLGLYMVKVCTKKLGGKVELLDNPLNFTEFFIEIPIKNKTKKVKGLSLSA